MHRLIKVDMSITGLIKLVPYTLGSVLFWLTDIGVNVKFLGVFLLLWTVDIISGVLKSIIVKDAKNPTSRTGVQRVASKFVMLMFPVVAAAIYSIFTDDAIKMLNWGLMILALHEGYSALGNFYSIRTGKNLTEFDAVSYSIKTMADWVRSKVERLGHVMEGGSRNDDWRDDQKYGNGHYGDHGRHGGYDLDDETNESEIPPYRRSSRGPNKKE